MPRDFPTDRAKDKARKAGESIPDSALYGLGAIAGLALLTQGDQITSEVPDAAFSVDQDADQHYAYLDGSASNDGDGEIVEYRWRPLLNGGPISPTKFGQQATYTVDQDLSQGSYGLELRVVDDDGNTDTATSPNAFTLEGEETICMGDDECPDGQECINGGCTPIDDPPNGDDPVNAVIDSYSVSGDTLSVSAQGGDSIAAWGWSLYLGAGLEDQATGQNANLTIDGGSGTYTIELLVTGTDGTQDTASETFQYNVPKDNSLTIGTIDRPGWAIYPDVSWEIRVSGELESNRGHDGFSASGTFGSGSEQVEFDYSGEITEFDWSGGPIAVWGENGNRIDPYSIDPFGGQRFRSDTGGPMFECTVRQTAALYTDVGYQSARNVADWLAGIFHEQGVSYDILYDLPLINSVSERSGCHNPFSGSTVCTEDGCNSIDCCSEDAAIPSAIHFWTDYANGRTDTQDAWNDATGNSTVMGGDVVSLRKDSNVLLVDALSGGCGYVGGMFSIAGGIRAANAPPYSSGTVTASNWGDGIHDAVHEMGHNFGFSHPANQDGSMGGGEAWVGTDGRWNRTPCVPCNGCVNRCGFTIEDRANVTANGVVRHLRYTDCTIDHLTGLTDGEQGQVQAAPSVGMHRNGTRLSDCGDCFDKDLETPGLGQQANDSEDGCGCECNGCSGDCDCGDSGSRETPQNRRELLRGGKVY